MKKTLVFGPMKNWHISDGGICTSNLCKVKMICYKNFDYAVCESFDDWRIVFEKWTLLKRHKIQLKTLKIFRLMGLLMNSIRMQLRSVCQHPFIVTSWHFGPQRLWTYWTCGTCTETKFELIDYKLCNCFALNQALFVSGDKCVPINRPTVVFFVYIVNV